MNYDDYKLAAPDIEDPAKCIYCGGVCDPEESYCSIKCANADLND
jgi:hypothetical protein